VNCLSTIKLSNACFRRVLMKNRPIRLLTLGLQTTAVLFCVALWKGEARALDSSNAITQYIHETWDSGSGLPKDMVRVVTQTRDGYIWLGTPAGAVNLTCKAGLVLVKSLYSLTRSALVSVKSFSFWQRGRVIRKSPTFWGSASRPPGPTETTLCRNFTVIRSATSSTMPSVTR